MIPTGLDLTVVLIALVAAAAVLLIISSSRGTRGSVEELALGAFILIGAILFPQAAAVILLGAIYRELRRRRPTP